MDKSFNITLKKYIGLSKEHRKWLEAIDLGYLNGSEKQMVLSVLRRNEYNLPAQEMLNHIRTRILKSKKI